MGEAWVSKQFMEKEKRNREGGTAVASHGEMLVGNPQKYRLYQIGP
jgi:hypothetical protein